MSRLIDNLTNFADQLATIQLADGTTFDLELMFHGATQRWVANVTYGDASIMGIGVCCHPNLLRQWMNVLPFGLACTTQDLTDPFDISDFSTGRVLLYVLDPSDVAEVEASIIGGTQS